MENKYISIIDTVKSKNPLVHHITNYVTVNDCANITLAIGGSPIMADDIKEVRSITSISNSLVLNIGTLNQSTISSMILSGKTANKLNIPIIFDPVGAGASSLRNKTTRKILNKMHVNVIRGNISEISFIAGFGAQTHGVDAANSDIKSLELSCDIAKSLASKMNCAVAITGKTDIISDGVKTVCIQNGHAMMSNISGTGCMCTSLIGSFCGANSDDILSSTANAVICMGVAGELAYNDAKNLGNGSFKVLLQDKMSRLSFDLLQREAKFYEV